MKLVKSALPFLFVLFVPGLISGQFQASEQKIIPITYDGHLYFKATINDTINGNFIFDTGAWALMLDSLYVSKQKLRISERVKYEMLGIGSKSQIVNGLDSLVFKFESLSYNPPSTPIIQLKPITGKEADGIIGLDYLKGNVFEVNYKKQYIKIITIDSAMVAGYEKIPIRMFETKILLDATIAINDKISITGAFTLDMGSGGSFDLTSAVATDHRLSHVIKRKRPYYTHWGGIGGSSSGVFFRCESITIGSFVMNEILTAYSSDKSGYLSKGSICGIIGNSIWERFDVIIDIPNLALYLKPNEDFEKPDIFKLTAGCGIIDRTDICDGWIVNVLYKKQSAEKSGLKLGDIITHVNGISTKDISKEERKNYFTQERGSLLLTVQRGAKILKINLSLKKIDL